MSTARPRHAGQRFDCRRIEGLGWPATLRCSPVRSVSSGSIIRARQGGGNTRELCDEMSSMPPGDWLVPPGWTCPDVNADDPLFCGGLQLFRGMDVVWSVTSPLVGTEWRRRMATRVLEGNHASSSCRWSTCARDDDSQQFGREPLTHYNLDNFDIVVQVLFTEGAAKSSLLVYAIVFRTALRVCGFSFGFPLFRELRSVCFLSF